jgi:hypothetical protein
MTVGSLSVTDLHFRLLLQNHWAICNFIFPNLAQIIFGWGVGFGFIQMKDNTSVQREIIATQ